MEEKKPIGDESVLKLPFSFKKEEISSQKIQEHWQKIANKIKSSTVDPVTQQIDKVEDKS